MREGHRANALLVELLLVIFFFMIGSATLVQVFANARLKSIEAQATSKAMVEAQNLAESLYGSDHPDSVIEAYGFSFSPDSDTWIHEEKEYTMFVREESEETESGTLRSYRISVEAKGKELLSIPSTRFIPKEVNP